MGLTDFFKILFGSNDQKNTKDFPKPDPKGDSESSPEISDEITKSREILFSMSV